MGAVVSPAVPVSFSPSCGAAWLSGGPHRGQTQSSAPAGAVRSPAQGYLGAPTATIGATSQGESLTATHASLNSPFPVNM